ncbi:MULTISPECIES: hypothetical protein [Halorussus]|uniref:hypothetical protein n=1 Tax=Halorussus TaxID=1070314 RepID=UPI0020A1FE74|nr:hypothetical protein [Halorussus vallis]USZ77292.1 hypothetical protein NGM07_08160 [Halorussus vallis]
MADDDSTTTTDHDEIRDWVEERDGSPAHVEGTGGGDDPGMLRIDFPDQGDEDEDLEDIGWDEFFEAFEDNDLAFLYQEETNDGETSYFCKFVSRQQAQ